MLHKNRVCLKIYIFKFLLLKGWYMSKLVKYGFGLMYLGLSFAAHSANFDCSKATQKVEKMICSDIELSAMDSDIYSAYSYARSATGNSKAFKENGLMAVKWRNQNCSTPKCIREWYRDREYELLRIAETGFVPPTNCVVSDSHVSVKGRISTKVFPGPPNYTDISEGDKPLTYWILKTEKPLCAYSSEMVPNYLKRISPQNEFQLVISDYEKYRNKLGRLVTVNGVPYPSHTGYHQTPLLITVTNIE